jgi:hypothetical protein
MRLSFAAVAGIGLVTALPQSAVAQFVQQAKIVGVDVIGDATQGAAVAISRYGTALINPATVFDRVHDKWIQDSELVARDAAGNAVEAFSLGLSSSGTTAVISDPSDNHGTGAAWIFERSFRNWREQAKLVPNIGVGIEAGYSASISGDGNTAIIGAPFANSEIGGAFVFVRRHGRWAQQAELIGTDVIGPFATQGTSVALSFDGDTAVVGGFNDNDVANGGNGAGAAWVFRRSHDSWRQETKLVGTGFQGVPMQGYSASVSDDGNTVIVGGPLDDFDIGAAWVFTHSYGAWRQQAKLVGTGVIGQFALQGFSVSLSGDGNTAVLGGFADNNNVGAAWVFTRSNGVWEQNAKLVGTGAISTSSLQGYSVAISSRGNTILSGGPGDSEAGAVWVFSRPQVIAEARE